MEYKCLRLFQKGIEGQFEAGAWMFSLDRKAGYQNAPLAEDSKQYFGFRWGGRYYQFEVLPFGWAPACFIYDTMSGVLASWFHRMKLHCINNFGFALPARTPPAERHVTIWKVWAVFYFAGFTNARDKSMVWAERVMALLGFSLDAIKQQYFVPERKVFDLLEPIHDVVARGAGGRGASVLALQSLVGKAQSMSLAVCHL
jgi:hypothetical protein